MIGARPRIFLRQVSASEVCREVGSRGSPCFDLISVIRSSIARNLRLFFSSNFLWWTALVILCVVLVAPLAVVDVPPLLDYPNHLARAYVLAHGQADLHLSKMYAPHWAIIPNLAIDLILPPLLLIMPVHTAGRILLAVALVLPVIGTILYSQAVFGRRSYWPLAGCLVACNGLFLLGFVNFQLAIGLALVCAAAWRRWRETRPVAAVVLGLVSAAILFFSHLMGLLFFLILLLSHEIERLRNVHQHGYSLTGNLLRAAWSMPIILIPSALYATSGFSDKAADISWETWPDKLIRAAMSVVNYNLPLDIVTACFTAGVLLILARIRLIVVPLGSVVALATIAILFMVSPFGFKGTGYVDARFAVMFGFLLFGTILPVRLPRKSALLVGFAVLALFGVRTAQIAAVWNAHNRDLDQFRSAMSAVEPGSRVLLATVSTEEASSGRHDFLQRQYLSDGSRLDGHTAGLLLIERHAFWPFLFANPDQQPVELRSPYLEIAQRTAGIPDVRLLSAPGPEPGDVERFPLEGQWSCCYDYVLLMEAGSRPDFHHSNLEALYQSDYASVFRVRQHELLVPTSPHTALSADNRQNSISPSPY
jgi:hypothetical protein